MKQISNLLLCVFVFMIPVNPLFANELSSKFYVSVNGNDNNPGTEEKPFETLLRAQKAVRALKTKDLTAPIEVIIEPGEYYLDKTLEFGPGDGGTAPYPVTWKAKTKKNVMIRGAKPVTGWTVYKNGIFKADLKKIGLKDVYFHQLFYKKQSETFSQRQILARYPDFDPKHPRTGGFLCTTDYAGDTANQQLIYEKGAIPFDKWGDISQAEVFTTYNYGWLTATTPITSVDGDKHTINFKKIRTHVIKFNRFFVQNILGALNQPGEWYLDYDESILYFYPPKGDIENAQIFVPVIDHIISLKGSIPYAHRPFLYAGDLHKEKAIEEYPVPQDVKMDPVKYMHFEGLDLECARQDAIRMTGVKKCSVTRCRITNVGNTGVNVGALTSSFFEVGNPRVVPATGEPVGAGGSGQILLANDPGFHCSVIGCDVWETGCEGIVLYGNGNLAENNHVYDNSIWAKDAPAINVIGVGNKARHNTLHDMPRCAIFFKGNNNLIELNDIHHVVLETTDMGAIRSVHRNIHIGGDIIRYNRIKNVPGYGIDVRKKGKYISPYYTFGVYLDDYTSRVTIFGNIISGVHRSGVVIHGGGQNLVQNNILINNDLYQMELAPIRPKKGILKHGFKGNYVKSNIIISTKENSVPYRYAIPDLNGNHRCYFANNLIYTGQTPPAVILFGNSALHWEDWMKMGEDFGSILAEPGLLDWHGENYHLFTDSSQAKELGVESIPFEKIGCYPSPQRASWPIEPNYDRFREEPVLYREPDFEEDSVHDDYELKFVLFGTEFQIPKRWTID